MREPGSTLARMDFTLTPYFEKKVLAKRPYITRVIDLDEGGHPVGIDIDQASMHLDLGTLDLRRMPFVAEKVAG